MKSFTISASVLFCLLAGCVFVTGCGQSTPGDKMSTTELQNLSDRLLAKIPELKTSIEEHDGITYLQLHLLGREVIVEKNTTGWGLSASLHSRSISGDAPEEIHKKIGAITDRIVKIMGA